MMGIGVATAALLGMIDKATLLPSVRVAAATVWSIFSAAWLLAFGLPGDEVADLDGAFRGEFAECMGGPEVNLMYEDPGSAQA